jgi:hypothetical protein
MERLLHYLVVATVVMGFFFVLSLLPTDEEVALLLPSVVGQHGQ